MYISAGESGDHASYTSCCGHSKCALFGMQQLFEGSGNKTQVWKLGGDYLRAASDLWYIM